MQRSYLRAAICNWDGLCKRDQLSGQRAVGKAAKGLLGHSAHARVPSSAQCSDRRIEFDAVGGRRARGAPRLRSPLSVRQPCPVPWLPTPACFQPLPPPANTIWYGHRPKCLGRAAISKRKRSYASERSASRRRSGRRCARGRGSAARSRCSSGARATRCLPLCRCDLPLLPFTAPPNTAPPAPPAPSSSAPASASG